MASNMANDRKRRILIVDDDPESLEVYRSYLEDDYYVGTVDYGPYALDYIEKNSTDLILMDILMPVMSGFEVFRAIRKMPQGVNVPVIFITGKSDRNLVLESMSMGVDGYLVKPVSKDKLNSKVNETLSQYENKESKYTVLAVDDDLTYLKSINSFLKDTFNMVMINTTALAVEYLASHPADVIILDYQMPDYKGSSLLKYIHDNPDLKNIPVIILTGNRDRNAVLERIKEKPDRFLLKPISKLDLMKSIISCLSEHGNTLFKN